MTSTVGLIGYPLAHSITPKIYAAAFEAMGLDARCEAWVTPAEALVDTIGRLREEGVYGANVTVPHKEAVIPLLDALDVGAAKIGAVNCIVRADGRLKGHNTDFYGFMRSLGEAGFEPAGKAAVLLGAGGAARAVAVGLLEAGAAHLTLSGRSRERVAAAAATLRARQSTPVQALAFDDADFADACRRADLIVNCTPVGTRHTSAEHSSPISRDLIRPGAFVYDLVYNPPLTRLLADARSVRATAVSGLEMLIYQGAESIRLWTGREPPLDIMQGAAREALGLESPGA